MQREPQKRKCRVLLIYREMTPSVRLCGHSQMQALAEQGRIDYRAVQEMKLRVSDLNWADALLLGRLDSRYERRLTQYLCGSWRRLVYIIDDDLLSITDTSAFGSATHFGNPEIQDNIRAMIDMCDAVLSPSPLLLEKYATDGREGFRIEEPAIDPVTYAPRDGKASVKIGFAGSIDRTADIETILGEALFRVRERYGDRVSFEFFGAVPAFARQLGARCVPYLDSYEAYRRQLNEMGWDIGLAPMPDTPFHACKHYNKFCEYAAAGIAGIYSDCAPYTFIPHREDFGRFCKNDPEDWFRQICAEIDDIQGREAHRQRGSEFARKALSPTVIGNELFDRCPSLFEVVEAEPLEIPHLNWLKARNVVEINLERLRRYGLGFPKKAVRKLRSKLKNRIG